MGVAVDIYPAPASSKDDGGSAGEACIDAMHRLLVAIEKKDVHAMHEALLLHESVCEDGGAAEEE